MKHEETEFYTPVPPVVTPGKSCGDAPSDAIILFDGKNLDQWVFRKRYYKAADWIVKKGVITVNKKSGNIQTKQSFMDYQIHIEWREPKDIEGADREEVTVDCFWRQQVKEMMDMKCRYWTIIIIKRILTARLAASTSKMHR